MRCERISARPTLTRRTLFEYGAAGGAFALAGSALARVIPSASPAAPASRVESFELDEATFADLQKKMVSGEETARSLAEKYIARIEALDRSGPGLRSVLEINPEAIDRNPSGSSSGSGAAAAANLCAAAVGTETDGSIVSPSNNCSLVGIKPTLGLASRSGIVPIAHSQDTPGPMCRTVADAAAL